MVVREAGLMFRGFTLVKKSYHKSTQGKIEVDLRSSLLTAFKNFAESAFSRGSVEYFEGRKYCITFIEDDILSSDSEDPEVLTSYAILDIEKKTDKYINKIILPVLRNVIREFKSRFNHKNLSEVSQFRDFKNQLDKIFGSDTQTVDQKLKGIFSQKHYKDEEDKEDEEDS